MVKVSTLRGIADNLMIEGQTGRANEIDRAAAEIERLQAIIDLVMDYDSNLIDSLSTDQVGRSRTMRKPSPNCMYERDGSACDGYIETCKELETVRNDLEVAKKNYAEFQRIILEKNEQKRLLSAEIEQLQIWIRQSPCLLAISEGKPYKSCQMRQPCSKCVCIKGHLAETTKGESNRG